MEGPAPVLTVLILTEDGSKHAHATLEALAKKMFRLVEPACQTQRERIGIDPRDERTQQAMAGNLWKSTRREDQQAIVDLRRSIATKLLEREVPGFVLFHFDGDRPWTKASSSENTAKFGRVIRDPVGLLVAGRTPDGSPDPLSKLIPVIPFYSIEAWLYQNTAGVRAEMKGQRGCKKADRQKLSAWEADPTLLDEVEVPKDNFCLGNRHNLALTEAFPAEKVLAVGKSFTATIATMKACPPLIEALAATAI
jgi:hypothetical protein